VLRSDAPTRLLGLAAFCDALLAPERELIVAALAKRGSSNEQLSALRDEARALGERGRNVRRASAATEREAQAAETQSKKWRAVRRLLRRAVEGDGELQKQWARC
jgi:hypothetical protein